MNRRAVRGQLMLILTALIWGAAFVAQRVGMDHLGPFSFNALRTLIGGVVLIPLALWNRKKQPEAGERGDKKALILGGCVCGAVLCVASNLQQAGIAHTTVGKAGFLTALYILIVPILGLFLGKKVRALFFLAVVIAALGMYLLTMSEALTISKGDNLVLLSALAFSVHILAIDHFSPRADGVTMALIQFFVSALLSAAPMLLIERPAIGDILAAWAPLLYAGALSCGVGYTLQILAQKDVNPVVASLLMSLESVFAALFGWLLLGQGLSIRELAGCALVFAGIILAQLPVKTKPAGR